jgi:DNA-binding NarL/FixJ family response regulator
VAVSRLDRSAGHATFLQRQRTDQGKRYVLVSAFAVVPQPFTVAAAVVLLSPAPELHGLTHRELQVLGLLVDGWPNPRMAAALSITARTVAAHIEHILVKLDAGTRTGAAVRALRNGLYVPQWPPPPACAAAVSPLAG